jgi:hypothetical protein
MKLWWALQYEKYICSRERATFEELMNDYWCFALLFLLRLLYMEMLSESICDVERRKSPWNSVESPSTNDHTQYKPAHKKPGTPKLCNLTITYQSIFYDVKCTYICNICDFFALPVCHIPRHGTHTWFWLVVSHSRDRLL